MAFVGFGILSTIIKSFSNRNWKLIYTAFGDDNYFKIVSKLNEDGVKYRTEIPGNLRTPRTYNDNTQYDIYVKKEDEHKAAHAMQR
jgi:hypothetical protein